MTKKKGGYRAAMAIIVAIVLFICALILIKTGGLKDEYDQKEKELAGINAMTVEAEQTTEDLMNEIKYRETDEYIEDQARDALGLRYPDEIILLPEGESGE